MLAKELFCLELSCLAHAESGGIVMGAKCPVMLTSRADDEKARLSLLRHCGALRGYLHK